MGMQTVWLARSITSCANPSPSVPRMTASFSACCKAFEEHYNLDNGILPVTAITAFPLSDAQAEKLTGRLARITGRQIKLRNRVDPTCLGGVRLDYDGKRLDDTVSHHLEAIRGLLKDTVL